MNKAEKLYAIIEKKTKSAEGRQRKEKNVSKWTANIQIYILSHKYQ